MDGIEKEVIQISARMNRMEERANLALSAIYGDGNGNKGLIRRVDKVDSDVNFIKKQNWVIITMLIGIMIAMFEKVMR